MRIISSFKDYYDFVAKIYGEDPKLIYRRMPDGLHDTLSYTENDKTFWQALSSLMYDRRKTEVYSWGKQSVAKNYDTCILVCGKLYVLKYVLVDEATKKYEISEVLAINEYVNEIKDHHKDDFFNSGNWRFTQLRTLDEASEDKYISIHKQFNSPIITFTREFKASSYSYNVIAYINVCLLEYKFETKIDAFQMFQDIQMFITNHLTPEVVINEVEDKHKIQQHGFNKQSFRHRKE